MKKKNDVTLLSIAFSAGLKRELRDDQLIKMIALNREEADDKICHSHDFCDPNVIMMEAFKECFQRSLDLTDPDQMDLVNKAWERAIKINFK